MPASLSASLGAADPMADLLNMKDLAQRLGVPVNTLKNLIERSPKFPSAARGGKGRPYEFDEKTVRAWIRENAPAFAANDEQYKRDVAEFHRRVYGDGKGDPSVQLGPRDRISLAKAAKAEDEVRHRRGELVEIEPLLAELAIMVVKARNELLRIPTDGARLFHLNRRQRDRLRDMIEAALKRIVLNRENGKGGGNGSNGKGNP